MEIWKQIKDDRVLSYYEVSSLGNIRNKNTNRMLKQKSKRGYSFVMLQGNNKRAYLQTHRAVLLTFLEIDNPKDYEVNHINRVRNDNRLENLEWVSHQENIDKIRTGVDIDKVEFVLKQYLDDSLTEEIIKKIRGISVIHYL